MEYCTLLTNTKRYSVFSNKNFELNEIIGEYLSHTYNPIGRKLYNKMYETAILGRYCNHHSLPNTYFTKLDNGIINLVANTKIKIGDEILVNYIEVEKLVGVPYLTYYRERFIDDFLVNFGKI